MPVARTIVSTSSSREITIKREKDAALPAGPARDPRFVTNAARFANRAAMQAELGALIAGWQSDALIAAMEAAGLPGGRVNEIPEILEDPHVAARGLVHTLARDDGTQVRVLGFPAKLSATPASCRTAPPRVGEDGTAVLASILGLDAAAIARLALDGIVQLGQMPTSEDAPI